ncbi:MAG: hypothetical protein H6618_04645 [Deltaproteobacteria bacterium]|nr:hypothetical protein [Deltaproteobacteria bacterium]
MEESTVKSKDRRKNSLMIRIPLFGFAGCLCLIVLFYLFLLIFIDGNRVREWTRSTILDKSGLIFQADEFHFNLNHGLSVSKIRLNLPGSKDSPETNLKDQAIFTADQLSLHYRLADIFSGKIGISEFSLLNPVLSLEKKEGVLNFDQILQHMNSQTQMEPDKAAEKPSESSSLSTFLPLISENFSLPVQLFLRKVAIKNLSILWSESSSQEGTMQSRKAELRGLSAQVQLEAQGKESDLILHLHQEKTAEKERLIVTYEASQGPSGQAADQKIMIGSELDIRLELKNLRNMQLSFRHKLDEVTGIQALPPELDSQLNISLSITEDLRKIRIEEMKAHIGTLPGTLAEFAATGDVTLLTSAKDRFLINLDSSCLLSLEDITETALPLIQQIQPELSKGLKASGYLELKSLSIKGVADPASLSSLQKPGSQLSDGLPAINARLYLNQISADIPAKGLRLHPVNGQIALSLSPALTGSGSQIDIYQDLHLEGVESASELSGLSLKSSVTDLSLRSLIRANWPSLEFPVIRNQIRSPSITAWTNGQQSFRSPFFLEQQAFISSGQEDASASLQVRSGKLLSIRINGRCEQKCLKTDVQSDLRLDSLESLLRIVRPFTRALGMEEKLPAVLTGHVNLHSEMTGSLPAFGLLSLQQLNQGAHINFRKQLNIGNFSFRDPLRGLDLKNLELNLSSSGDLRKQQSTFSCRIDSAKILTAGTETTEAQSFSLSRFAINQSLQSERLSPFPEHFSPEWLLSAMKAEHELDLYWGSLDTGAVFPAPLKDFRMKTALSVHHGRKINLRELQLQLPDFGATLKSNLTADFSSSILQGSLPQTLKGNIDALIDQSGTEDIPLPFKSSGKFSLNLGVHSRDHMATVLTDGKLEFNHFSLKSADQEGSSNPPMIIHDVNGNIPFQRTFDLSMLSSSEKKHMNPADNPEENDRDDSQISSVPELESLLSSWEHRSLKLHDVKKNAMTLADYNHIRPFYPTKQSVRIARLAAANLMAEDLEFDIELSQNWISLNQFMMTFLDGQVQGSVQLGFDGLHPHTLRSTLHLSHLDTHKLLDRFPALQQETDSGLLSADPWLDASVHLNYRIPQQDISGGINITSIGKEQLRMMLFYVDPEEKDPAIEKVRSALRFGEVDLVQIPIKNGEADIDVGVRLMAGIPFPLPKITHISLATILNNMMKQSSKKEAEEQKKTL